MTQNTVDSKEISLSQKEVLLMRLSNHIEQAQVDSPAFFLSNLALKGNEELVNEFLGDQPSMDTSTLETFLQSQLYVSCFWGLYDIVKVLLDNKADPNFQNFRTLWTPLHAAAFQDHGRIVMLLLEYGANPMSKDYKARTPADFASVSDKIWSHFDVINIPRTSVSDLIKKNILKGNPESTPQNTGKYENGDKTSSGIKLASYRSSSNHLESGKSSENHTLPSSASSSRRSHSGIYNKSSDNTAYQNSLFDSTSLPSTRPGSKSTFGASVSRIGAPNSINDASNSMQGALDSMHDLENGVTNIILESPESRISAPDLRINVPVSRNGASVSRHSALSSRSGVTSSRSGASDSSQMKDILGNGGFTSATPMHTGRRSSRRTSGSVLNILTWE